MTITLTTERLKQFALDKRMCNVTDEIISMALELIGSRETIDAQAARIAEQQAVIDQRNGECDRLINELAALREQNEQRKPFGWLRVVSGSSFQIMEGSQRPPDRSGDCVGPWFAVYTQPAPVAVSCEPIDINNDMAIAFCHAISDSAVSADDVEEVKTGLKAAFANVPAAPVAVTDEIEPDDSNTFDYVDGWNACRAEMLRLNSGSEPFVVKLPETFYAVIQQGKVAMLPAKDGHWLNLTSVKEAIRAAGGEIAE